MTFTGDYYPRKSAPSGEEERYRVFERHLARIAKINDRMQIRDWFLMGAPYGRTRLIGSWRAHRMYDMLCEWSRTITITPRMDSYRLYKRDPEMYWRRVNRCRRIIQSLLEQS